MDIKQIDWQQALPIRHRVLWPNKAPEFSHVEGDENAIHYGVFVDGNLVSVASIFIQNNQARLRKFATLTCQQGCGFGSKLITHIIAELKGNNIDLLWCDARLSAIVFYERFGMKRFSDEFYKSGTAYVKMSVHFK